MSGRPLISRTAMPGLGLSAGITLFMLTLVVFLPIGALLWKGAQWVRFTDLGKR